MVDVDKRDAGRAAATFHIGMETPPIDPLFGHVAECRWLVWLRRVGQLPCAVFGADLLYNAYFLGILVASKRCHAQPIR